MGRHRTIDDEELLKIARRVFRQGGHTASTRDVARAAGISQAVLYQRFRSKDDLFFAAMFPPPPDLGVLLGDEDEAGRGARRHLTGIATRVLGYFTSAAPAILHLVTHPSFPEMMAHAHHRFLGAGLVDALADRLRALSRRGLIAPVDAGAAAEALVAAMHSVALFRIFSGTADVPANDARARRVVQVLWSGLKPRRRRGPTEGAEPPKQPEDLVAPRSTRADRGTCDGSGSA
ncbi:helix-turn-helix domain-containing protein [Sorangium sp. So ce321]|uniref:TetR/AcrR family transcriptional regulator n=1 Tax=Sorangium sp. So ce321 TaxID=3133300 RepID=UPI003F615FCC